MADIERPFEGHFVVGGSGLYVATGCLGQTFDSRTASWDLTIGLPQVDKRPDPIPLEIREHLGETPLPKMDLIPPTWAYGPASDSERSEEEYVSPVWGGVLHDGQDGIVYPESVRDSAVVYRCRFYTTLEAADGDDLEEATQSFLGELDDWWTRFTSWVGILTGQDFVGLGGNPGGITRAHPLFTWTSDQNGQRTGVHWRYFPPPDQGVPTSKLTLKDLQTCVNAAGYQSPPAEWLFIRDARSMLRVGQTRRAVLDAGTAAELAMTALIDRHLDNENTEQELREAITRAYANLGAKKELLRILRPGLLSARVPRVQTELIDLRNTASHGRSKAGRRWDEITFEQAQTAVEVAAVIVELAYPLADLVSLGPNGDDSTDNAAGGSSI